jgi:hypothetical protein
MKTTIQMHGYEITIEEREEGLLTVSATKDGEVIEEFELEAGEDHQGMEDREEGEEMEMGDDEDMSAFGEEEDDLGEESDEEEMQEEGEPEEGGEEEMQEEGALESFSSFFKKGTAKKINESKGSRKIRRK